VSFRQASNYISIQKWFYFGLGFGGGDWKGIGKSFGKGNIDK
jgi:hypothetical protein